MFHSLCGTVTWPHRLSDEEVVAMATQERHVVCFLFILLTALGGFSCTCKCTRNHAVPHSCSQSRQAASFQCSEALERTWNGEAMAPAKCHHYTMAFRKNRATKSVAMPMMTLRSELFIQSYDAHVYLIKCMLSCQ